MTILRKGLLGLIIAIAVLTVAGPVIAVSLLLAAFVSVFALVVCLWAFVLLAERWVDEGLGGYHYFDALGDALDDVVHGFVTSILSLRPSSIRKALAAFVARIVGALPLLGQRALVIRNVVILTVLTPILVVIQGTQSVRSDFRGVGQGIKDRWAGAYL